MDYGFQERNLFVHCWHIIDMVQSFWIILKIQSLYEILAFDAWSR